MITVDSRKDLNSLFISIFETFSLHPENVVELPWPTTYTRQMLATLVKAGLVHTEEADDGTYYQCLHTYDEINVDEAQRQFDEWFDNNATSTEGTSMTTTASTRTAKSATLTPCYCGCKGMSKGFYLPGHDARHAGQVGRAIAANYTTKGFDRRTLLNDLPSEKLVAKAERIAETAIAKIEKKAKPSVKEDEHGIVKVGKTEYVAVREASGLVRYLTADGDEWKSASKTAAKTFQVG